MDAKLSAWDVLRRELAVRIVDALVDDNEVDGPEATTIERGLGRAMLAFAPLDPDGFPIRTIPNAEQRHQLAEELRVSVRHARPGTAVTRLRGLAERMESLPKGFVAASVLWIDADRTWGFVRIPGDYPDANIEASPSVDLSLLQADELVYVKVEPVSDPQGPRLRVTELRRVFDLSLGHDSQDHFHRRASPGDRWQTFRDGLR